MVCQHANPARLLSGFLGQNEIQEHGLCADLVRVSGTQRSPDVPLWMGLVFVAALVALGAAVALSGVPLWIGLPAAMLVVVATARWWRPWAGIGCASSDEVQSGLVAGTRVRVVRSTDFDGPWRQEFLGTIDPEADAPIAVVDPSTLSEYVSARWPEPIREFLVRFDEPQIDAEGAGPYCAAVIWETYLVRVAGDR